MPFRFIFIFHSRNGMSRKNVKRIRKFVVCGGGGRYHHNNDFAVLQQRNGRFFPCQSFYEGCISYLFIRRHSRVVFFSLRYYVRWLSTVSVQSSLLQYYVRQDMTFVFVFLSFATPHCYQRLEGS